MKIAQSVLECIGGTPLVRLNRLPDPEGAVVLAKLESVNPSGSVKDRAVAAMVQDAEAGGLLQPGGTIVEASSGNTAIALAMVAAAKGYRLILSLPEGLSPERLRLLTLFGAEIISTPASLGMAGAVAAAKGVAEKTPGCCLLQQFDNPANPQAHRRTMAREILEATGGKVNAFVAGIGTGGTVTGVGEALKEKVPGVQVIGVEPAGSPFLTRGKWGRHSIPGLGAPFMPKVLNRGILDEIMTVSDEEAHDIMARLAREEGLLVGPSSGANVTAALRVARKLSRHQVVVTVLPDTGMRYLAAANL